MSLRRASALTGRTELSFDTRRLEWLTLYEAARALRSDYSAVPLAPRATDPNPPLTIPKKFPNRAARHRTFCADGRAGGVCIEFLYRC